MELKVKDNLGIIDADFICFCVGWTKDGAEEKNLEETLEATDEYIREILIATKSNYYIGCITQGKSSFRYQVDTQYKANRKYKATIKYIAEVKEHMRAKWGFVYNEELESDDICVIARKQYKNDYNVTLLSPDNDLIYLEGQSYDYKNRKFHTIYKEQAEYKFWMDMICGQPGDNIKGISKKGKVFAEKLLNPLTLDSSIYSAVVLKEYITCFGEQKGIEEFYKNYKCLKIVDEWKDYKVIQPIKFSEVDEYKKEDY